MKNMFTVKTVVQEWSIIFRLINGLREACTSRTELDISLSEMLELVRLRSENEKSDRIETLSEKLLSWGGALTFSEDGLSWTINLRDGLAFFTMGPGCTVGMGLCNDLGSSSHVVTVQMIGKLLTILPLMQEIEHPTLERHVEWQQGLVTRVTCVDSYRKRQPLIMFASEALNLLQYVDFR